MISSRPSVASIALLQSQHFPYTEFVRFQYVMFNIRFIGPKVCNSIGESKKISNIVRFKQKLKKQFIAKI